MKVLVLSTNRTVSDMVALALASMPTVELLHVHEVNHALISEIDVILVDDRVPEYRTQLNGLTREGAPITVLLHHAHGEVDPTFDLYVPKPFLPSEIREIIEECAHKRVQRDEKNPPLIHANTAPSSPPKTRKKKKKIKQKGHQPKHRAETEVLNLDEIETIRSLLDEDGLEIVPEAKLAEKMIEEHDGKVTPHRDPLTEAFTQMKPKKMRRLLKGATVRIEITFPGDDT